MTLSGYRPVGLWGWSGNSQCVMFLFFNSELKVYERKFLLLIGP